MKYAFSLLLFILVGSNDAIDYFAESLYKEATSSHNQTDIKDVAFLVLRDKCNVCHATKKKTDIFTLQNMDSLATDIHKQVFIKKKMPKGRKIKLTDDERSQLKTWLDETLAEN